MICNARISCSDQFTKIKPSPDRIALHSVATAIPKVA